MEKKLFSPRSISRRDFLRLGGGLAVATAGAGLLASRAGALLRPARSEAAASSAVLNTTDQAPADVVLLGTDGWAYLPPVPAVPPWHPDPWAPAPFTTYLFGLRDITNLTLPQQQGQVGKSQISASMIHADEGQDLRIQLFNPGFVIRPDLVDAHTVHWHGFRNQIPYYDGSPMDSIGVPAGRRFTYFYRLREPGTYMYHCHFEDTEHVHMGMTGSVFVRPAQNAGNPGLGIPAGKYVYNDGVLPGDPRSTAYDREFVLLLTEIWSHQHWNAAHIQETDWSDYEPDFFLLNGRTYPYTLAPNGGGNDPVTGDLIAPSGYPELQYQPISSLIQANAGDRVLLRIANLGFKLQTMTLPGLDLRVVGKDATLLRGRDGSDLSYRTNNISIGPGESVDAIFTAPSVSTQTNYLFYNRNYNHLSNGGGPGYGGQMTEVRVFPAGTLPPQTQPNS